MVKKRENSTEELNYTIKVVGIMEIAPGAKEIGDLSSEIRNRQRKEKMIFERRASLLCRPFLG